LLWSCFFFFQAEDGIRAFHVTGVQTCALPISLAAIVFLAGLWEWLKLAEVEDSLHRTILLLLNLLLMVLMVWAAQGSFVLLQIEIGRAAWRGRACVSS